MKPWDNEVVAVHVIPPDTGCEHMPEDGTCWCVPLSFSGDGVNLPPEVTIFVHKKFKPNWG